MRRLVVFCILLLFIGYINAQVVENPVFDRIDVSAFRVQKIEIKKDTTYVYCSYSAEAGSWANISKETCLYVRNANKKYPLLRCDGLPFSPQQKSFMFAERCNVLLCFPSIRNMSKFDLIENESDKAFNIYGIDISNKYQNSYQESEVSRFSNMASFYDSAGDTIKALQFKTKEIEAIKYVYGVKSEPLIVSLLNASIMYDKYGFSEQAIEIAKQEGGIHAELWGTTDWNYALYLRTLGQFYSHAKEYDNSIKTYKESIQLFESLNIVDNEYALALFFIAGDCYEIGDSDNALIYQRKSLKARRQIGEAEVYNSISHYYQSAERLDNAERYIKKAIDVLNKHDNAEQYIMDAVVQTGNSMMNNPFALASIKQRIDTDKSNFLQTLARIYQKQGNYANAVITEMDNGKILREMGDTQMYAVHLMTLSEYYLKTTNNKKL